MRLMRNVGRATAETLQEGNELWAHLAGRSPGENSLGSLGQLRDRKGRHASVLWWPRQRSPELAGLAPGDAGAVVLADPPPPGEKPPTLSGQGSVPKAPWRLAVV